MRLLDVKQVCDRLFLIGESCMDDVETDSGGNSSLFITSRGAVLVDTKLPEAGEALCATIASITDVPVTVVINTHNHIDHTGNNHRFPDATRIAHVNAALRMSQMEKLSRFGTASLPNQTYHDRLVIGSGEDRVEVYYFGKGHTAGDSWVVFPEYGVVQTGEMFCWKGPMLCDQESGGDCLAFPETLSSGVRELHGIDIVIPAHSKLAGWRELEEYESFNAAWMAVVTDHYRRGRGVEDAVTAALATVDAYPGYEKYGIRTATTAIYGALQERHG